MPSLNRQSLMVVHASRAGVVLNSNLTTGGGTDAAAALQAILNRAQVGPLHLVIDGAALIGTPLKIYSNTTIEFPAGCGLYAKQGLNGPLLRNANFVSGYNSNSPVYDGSTIVDKNITIRGGYLNGNRGNGTTGNCTSGDARVAATTANGIVAGQVVGNAMFFGVKNLVIRDLYSYDAPTYLLWMANCFGVRIAGVSLISPRAGAANGTNTDGIHLDGPIDDLASFGLTVATGDDAIAINADDLNVDGNTGPVDGVIAYGSLDAVYKGPITRVLFDGVAATNCFSILRILSGPSFIDEVTVANVTGSCYYHAVVGDLYPVGGGTATKGRVTLQNWAVDQTASGDGMFMSFAGVYHSLKLIDISRTTASTAGLWPIQVAGTVYNLEIAGLTVVEPVSKANGPLVSLVGATVSNCRINGTWVRPGLGTAAIYPFVQVNAASTVSDLRLDGIVCQGTTGVLSHGAGTLANVRATGCSYHNGSGNAVVTTGTITNYATSGNLGMTTTGTITNTGVNL